MSLVTFTHARAGFETGNWGSRSCNVKFCLGICEWMVEGSEAFVLWVLSFQIALMKYVLSEVLTIFVK